MSSRIRKFRTVVLLHCKITIQLIPEEKNKLSSRRFYYKLHLRELRAKRMASSWSFRGRKEYSKLFWLSGSLFQNFSPKLPEIVPRGKDPHTTHSRYIPCPPCLSELPCPRWPLDYRRLKRGVIASLPSNTSCCRISVQV